MKKMHLFSVTIRDLDCALIRVFPGEQHASPWESCAPWVSLRYLGVCNPDFC